MTQPKSSKANRTSSSTPGSSRKKGHREKVGMASGATATPVLEAVADPETEWSTETEQKSQADAISEASEKAGATEQTHYDDTSSQDITLLEPCMSNSQFRARVISRLVKKLG